MTNWAGSHHHSQSPSCHSYPKVVDYCPLSSKPKQPLPLFIRDFVIAKKITEVRTVQPAHPHRAPPATLPLMFSMEPGDIQFPPCQICFTWYVCSVHGIAVSGDVTLGKFGNLKPCLTGLWAEELQGDTGRDVLWMTYDHPNETSIQLCQARE